MRSPSSSMRSVRRNRDHVGPRRHHVAHALFAEFDHLLDQPRLVLLDDAFLGRRVDKRLDRLLIGGGRAGLVFGEPQNRSEKIQHGIKRPRKPQQNSHERHERRNPIPARARQQQERQKLHRDHHFGGEEDDDLDAEFRAAGHSRVHGQRGDRRKKHQPEPREQAEGERGARTVELETRLDFGFEGDRRDRGCGLSRRRPISRYTRSR